MIKYLILFGAFISLTACDFKQDEQRVIAQVYDYKLYEQDMAFLVPTGVSSADSMLIVQDFINQWTHQHAILHKANVNESQLESEVMKMEKQVEDYRNSLIVYRYTQRLIEQKLDTIVNYSEVEEYYSAHKSEFTLKDDIVQVAFIKLPADSKNLKQIKKLFKEYKEEDEVKIRNIAEDKAVNYFLDKDTWILFDDLLKEIPLESYNTSLYLQNNKYIEVEDSLYAYILRINNYRTRDSSSPLSFEYERVKSIIINIRKMELIERMKQDVFKEAQENGEIHILI